ncbi:ATP-grasp domain-containing protein [Bacillus cereus]|uniref:ATP-grasp domain-containing protein n=1 Tax=Bacillus cereus TaxID=1396 RepID=UPI002406A2E5|nr:ATP-grasp domain-containing protein [Bacillus cereus]MDF9495343.1 ATP-grasp domain-containing protein [Bacillus cereus]MEC3248612.1 ATP-grasp domain-containing protein [Bacillus cereus]
MSILILNRVPYFMYPYDQWLNNEELILLTSSNVAESHKGKGYKEIYTFDNFDNNGHIELKALELFDKYKYHSIIATNELDLLRAANLRDYLAIMGQNWESAIAYRNKVKMKEILSDKGVSVPKFKQIETPLDVINFVQENGYPIVVKPIDGTASTNTGIVKDKKDFDSLLSLGLSPNIEVEEFIEGDMYHVDGIVMNGEIVFIWPSKYLNGGCLAFQDNKYLGSYILGKKNPLFNRIINYTEELIRSLPTPQNTVFHAELFHTPNDELVLCEIASRIAGAYIPDVISQSFDINLRKIMVQMQCNVFDCKPNFILNNGPDIFSGWLFIPPKDGTFVSGPSNIPFEWVTNYRLNANPGDRYYGAKTSIDKIASFVISGSSEEIVLERLIEVANWFQQSVKWEF